MKRMLRRGLLALACAGFASSAGAQTEQLLLSFGGKNGDLPGNNGNLLMLANGHLVGTALHGGKLANSGLGIVFEALPPTSLHPSWRESVIYRFQGGYDGYSPLNGLTAGKKGVLYGLTAWGGDGNTSGGCGVAYQLTPPSASGTGHWAESVLYRFSVLLSAGDGCRPYNGEPLFDKKTGSLYGTTEYGGSAGTGTLFRLDPPASPGGAWTETILYQFTGQFDGTNPAGVLTEDSNGIIYGASQNGGAFSAGAVWTYNTKSSQFDAIYEFQGGTDGANPQGGVIGPFLASPITQQYYLLGTSSAGGGSTNCSGGCGTVFTINLAPVIAETTDTILHAFQGSDGTDPKSGLVMIGSAAYGTAYIGGNATSYCTEGCGTLFEIQKSGFTHTVLTYEPVYSFAGPPNDGAYPESGVAGDSAGDVYGLTNVGGGSSVGALFEYVP
jgi:uncharacterized repeat protein (TIGR03803 family)